MPVCQYDQCSERIKPQISTNEGVEPQEPQLNVFSACRLVHAARSFKKTYVRIPHVIWDFLNINDAIRVKIK